MELSQGMLLHTSHTSVVCGVLSEGESTSDQNVQNLQLILHYSTV